MGSDTVLNVKHWHRPFYIERFARLDHAVDKVRKLAHHSTNHRLGGESRLAQPIPDGFERLIRTYTQGALRIR